MLGSWLLTSQEFLLHSVAAPHSPHTPRTPSMPTAAHLRITTYFPLGDQGVLTTQLFPRGLSDPRIPFSLLTQLGTPGPSLRFLFGAKELECPSDTLAWKIHTLDSLNCLPAQHLHHALQQIPQTFSTLQTSSAILSR